MSNCDLFIYFKLFGCIFFAGEGDWKGFSLLLWLLYGHWLLFPLPLRSVILCFGCFSDFSHNLNDDFSMQVENSFLNENKGCVLSITYVLFNVILPHLQ